MAAIREGVAAAQSQPVAEVVVQLRICRQTGLLPAGGVEWKGGITEVGENWEEK